MDDFKRYLNELFQMTPEEIAATEIDPLVKEAFETFEKMDEVARNADEVLKSGLIKSQNS